MKQRFFIFDPTSCFGCLGCVAACAAANQTPPDRPFRSLLKLPPKDGKSNTLYLSLSCNHCGNAPCVRACPTEALARRSIDGVIWHRPERCIGCQYCQMACPYDAIRWDSIHRTIGKCQFCYERLDADQEPACVATCFSGALKQQLVDDAETLIDADTRTVGFEPDLDSPPSIRFVCRLNKRLGQQGDP
ncbi:MAG: 4Fe-4S binding protein [Myxococcota bacterium]|nr:4Fe-4S binding protein [Myxococcota bacterium]